MRVRELMEQLQRFDPYAKVTFEVLCENRVVHCEACNARIGHIGKLFQEADVEPQGADVVIKPNFG